MAISAKASTIIAVTALAAGLLVGFIPTHFDNASLMVRNSQLQSEVDSTRGQLTLSRFTVRSAELYTDSAKNNLSVASSSASSFFTDLRTYIDKSKDVALKQQLEGVMSGRDAIIAGLAKADPAVTAKLQETFVTMQKIDSDHTPSL
jgi:hypothetical protein